MIAATPVLIPGTMCDARLWTDRVRDALPGAIDADVTRDASIEAMASRALAAASGPLLPVGFSMGGIVALEMARQAPGRIAGMILLDTEAAADPPALAAARPRHQAEARAGGLERIVVSKLVPNYLAGANRSDAALPALVRDMAMALGPDIFVAQSEALRTRRDLRPVVPALASPLLVACGAEDRLCPPAGHRTLAQSAPGATLRVIEGAGHMLPLEQPARLASIIRQWREAA